MIGVVIWGALTLQPNAVLSKSSGSYRQRRRQKILRCCCCQSCRGARDKALATLLEGQTRQRRLGGCRQQGQAGEVQAELLQELGLLVLGPRVELPLRLVRLVRRQVLVLQLLLLVVVLLLLLGHAAGD
jgi:hypothetical protein